MCLDTTTIGQVVHYHPWPAVLGNPIEQTKEMIEMLPSNGKGKVLLTMGRSMYCIVQ